MHGDQSGFHTGIVRCESALISVYSQKPQVMDGLVVLLPNENKIKIEKRLRRENVHHPDHNRDSKSICNLIITV